MSIKNCQVLCCTQWQLAAISHAGLVENLKPPDLSEPGLEGYFSVVDVKQLYLPGNLHGEDK